jgi:hypothetical protein
VRATALKAGLRLDFRTSARPAEVREPRLRIFREQWCRLLGEKKPGPEFSGPGMLS